MTFLQPTMLWALPAALLPVLIHFLNRLRYRSVKWAAMIFLIAANQSSTRRARLRQWLILLARVLTLLLFILALCRPIVGGWVGTRMAGAPDTILILLDRSASMEAMDPRRMISKREHALALFTEAAETATGSRLVLIDSALLIPHEIASAEALAELSIAGPTDTAADMPAMFRAALDYMVENRTGRTEIWVASDMQRSGWQPESGEWTDLATRIGALPQDVRVRVLGMTEDYGRNMSIALREMVRHDSGGRSTLAIALDIESRNRPGGSFPLILTLNGNRSQIDVEMTGQRLHHRTSIDLGQNHTAGGWGKLEVPADENVRDNSCYFVYGEPVPLAAGIAAEQQDAARHLRLACAPRPDDPMRSAATWDSDSVGDMPMSEMSLVAWQLTRAPAVDETLALTSFVESGGSLLFLPTSPNLAATPAKYPFNVDWAPEETAPANKPFRVVVWDENDGPLARTAAGIDLPVAALAISRRRCLNTGGDSPSQTWYPVAAYDDGAPFLLRRRMGRGQVFVCTTLPSAGWSDLASGPVLVPMLQRMMYAGAVRLGSSENAVFGRWRSADSGNIWMPLEKDVEGDVRSIAGAYRSGTALLALNRPAYEDDPALMPAATAVALLGSVPCQVLSDLSNRSETRLQSEIWHLFIYCALLFLLVESILLLMNRKRPARPGAGTGRVTA